MLRRPCGVAAGSLAPPPSEPGRNAVDSGTAPGPDLERGGVAPVRRSLARRIAALGRAAAPAGPDRRGGLRTRFSLPGTR